LPSFGHARRGLSSLDEHRAIAGPMDSRARKAAWKEIRPAAGDRTIGTARCACPSPSARAKHRVDPGLVSCFCKQNAAGRPPVLLYVAHQAGLEDQIDS